MASDIDPQGRESQALFGAVDFSQARVIEIGCGDGRLTFRYGNISKLVVGVEPSPARLAAAAGARPSPLKHRLHFMRASAMSLPFRAERFDIALFAKSL
jgi:ubiquinone/menaquinone biosynthesis C-methylase UbiE